MKKRKNFLKVLRVAVIIITLWMIVFRFADFGEIKEFLSEHWGIGIEEDRIISQSEEWNLIVVNAWNKIPEDYELELTELSDGHKVDSRIYPYLQEMFDAARSEGVYPIVREAFRTQEEQQKILDDKILAYMCEGYPRNRATRLARQWVSLPGTSEHQLGIAVDINGDKEHSTNEEVYAWLAENAYKYGFILRYPLGKEDVTGASYEPWHYRYVGIEAAKEIYEQGVCLEEYVMQL